MDHAATWKLDKYARSVENERSSEWDTFYTSPEKPLNVALSKEGVLKVFMGGMLLEYWNLPMTKSMKTYTKYSYILFRCKSKSVMRKWRIQFSGGGAAITQCNHCFTSINKYLMHASLSAAMGPSHQCPPSPPECSSSHSDKQISQDHYSPIPSNPVGMQQTPSPQSLSLLSSSVVDEPTKYQITSDVANDLVSTQDENYISNFPQPQGLDLSPGAHVQPRTLDHLSQSPLLEEMVRAALHDPKLPDLVEAVHRIIANM